MVLSGNASRTVAKIGFIGEYFHTSVRTFGFLNSSLFGFTTVKVLLLIGSTSAGFVSDSLDFINLEKHRICTDSRAYKIVNIELYTHIQINMD